MTPPIPPKIPLVPLAIGDAPSIWAIELFETKQGPQLLSSTTGRQATSVLDHETVISSTPVAGDSPATPRLFELPHPLPSPPSWDVGARTDGSPAVVYEFAGGAINSILFKGIHQREDLVSAVHPFESFSDPRFFKRAPDPTRVITAVVESKTAVQFQRRPDGSFGSYDKMLDCRYALGLHFQGRDYLFSKELVPGPVRGNLISPGKLSCTELGKNLKPKGQAVEIFRGEVVFEFDVDATGNVVLVFATTKSGTVLARGPSPLGSLTRTGLDEEDNGEAFSQPSVVAAGSFVYLAVLKQAQTDAAKVLTGTTPL